MQTPSTWFFNVRAGWKAIVSIAAILGAGFTVGAAAGGVTKIPARVTALESRADSLNGQLKDIRRDVVELRRLNSIQLCFQVAERRKTDWRECLK